jgi:hypothetical protein
MSAAAVSAPERRKRGSEGAASGGRKRRVKRTITSPRLRAWQRLFAAYSKLVHKLEGPLPTDPVARRGEIGKRGKLASERAKVAYADVDKDPSRAEEAADKVLAQLSSV